ncbi:acyl-CoA dehydrogenase (plasmid) [Pseudonocardia sp. EC080610-09]|uniref:acyl-CoA dehydrogenase family protein n=1 Tax=unclassified Pseudonocardia TaxID=2619320 RepID=UPI000705F727|nr:MULTISPECIES: acyl-CoA dehydrogenase family protein [unclassified Pseudonocardia]ALL79458.1 acyl-CoA dehydrogenase [Pseudonocardia sp. EC080610-09]ALL85589.1 acyl-CoA dehydrogenase [Pseudonocardia sp. EC080619-01]
MTAPPLTLPVPDLSDGTLAAVTAQLSATAEHHDRTGAVPRAGLDVVHRAGLLTATVAARHGGPGAGDLDTARILVALGEGDPSVALIVANTLNVHRAQAANAHWPPAAYADLLRRSAQGPAPANAVRAESELGAPARGGLPATVARRTADGWSLSGHKAYATGGTALAYHLVWARADEPGGAPDAPRVGHVVVPADTPGITWLDSWDHLGLRASNTHDVVYDGVTLGPDAFVEIPRVGGVYRDPAAATGPAGLGHGALYVGVARAARAAFVGYARGRVPAALGRPIAETDRIATVAGEIDAQVAQAETLLYGALLRTGTGDIAASAQLSLLKVQIARSAIAAVQTAVAALGNAALTRHHPLERHLRDVLCVRVHPPQEDAALLTAGRRLLAGTT